MVLVSPWQGGMGEASMNYLAVGPVLVASMGFQITEFRELT